MVDFRGQIVEKMWITFFNFFCMTVYTNELYTRINHNLLTNFRLYPMFLSLKIYFSPKKIN